MTGYIFIAVLLLIAGIYVYINNILYRFSSLTESFSIIPLFYIFLIPIICAGVISEEKRRKTSLLLYTLPLTSGQIVGGKYLAVLTVLACPLLIISLYPVILSTFGTVNILQALVHVFGLFLLGAALCAICLFISSITEGIVVSMILCVVILFALYEMNGLAEALGPSAKNGFIGLAVCALLLFIFILVMTKNIIVALIPTAIASVVLALIYRTSELALAGKLNKAMTYLAVFERVDSFASGILDLRMVIYYLSIIAVFILLTVYCFEGKRWS